jgi:lipoprotein-releasing system ATP-binding protein
MVALLEARDLSKSYIFGNRPLSVLAGLSLVIEEGEMVSIVGASGVGKSTLLHLLGGVDRPSSGEVLYRGEALSGIGNGKLARFRNREVGFVFQFHFLMPEFTALENVTMPLLIGGESPASARRRSKELLADVGLGERFGHRPGELSGGEQQRVAIARAVACTPRVLLADEPTGNLDRETGRSTFAILEKLNRERGLTMLVVTHNPELAEAAGRCFRLSDGRLTPLQAS